MTNHLRKIRNQVRAQNRQRAIAATVEMKGELKWDPFIYTDSDLDRHYAKISINGVGTSAYLYHNKFGVPIFIAIEDADPFLCVDLYWDSGIQKVSKYQWYARFSWDDVFRKWEKHFGIALDDELMHQNLARALNILRIPCIVCGVAKIPPRGGWGDGICGTCTVDRERRIEDERRNLIDSEIAALLNEGLQWDGERATFGESYDDFGPCACGLERATHPVSIPVSWDNLSPAQEAFRARMPHFDFAGGYDYRRIWGPGKIDNMYCNFSACRDCCLRAEKLGMATYNCPTRRMKIQIVSSPLVDVWGNCPDMK